MQVANNANLEGKGFESRTTDEQREIAKMGGIESGRVRRQKRDLRQALEMLLEKEYKSNNGKMLTGAEAISAKLFEQAMNGNVKAFETLRDTVGQKPVDKVEMKTDVNIEESTARLKSLFDGIANNDG